MKKTKLKILVFSLIVLVLIRLDRYIRRNDANELVDCSTLPPSHITNKQYLTCVSQRGLKSVQVLTQFYDWPYWKDEWIGLRPFENCSVKTCFAFRYNSNSQEALEESNGVIVHAANLLKLPSRKTYNRNPKQLWSLFTIESQRFSFCLLKYKLTDLDDWFNLTKTVKDKYAYMTYDLKNLDRYEPYREVFKRLGLRDWSLINADGRRRQAVWFVSHCSTPNLRELVVRELSNYIDIDIYGKCGFKNSKPDPCEYAADKRACTMGLLNSYKFYLSFENSNCDSYITEKYFRFYESDFVFEVDIVPIVRGAKFEQYLERAPSQNSFIFAENFSSVRSLADYIVYLDRNDSAYREYFGWKSELFEKLSGGRAEDEGLWQPSEFSPMCDLCEKLHDETYLNRPNNSIIKISEIYNPVKDCSQETVSQEKLMIRLNDNCWWAEYHLDYTIFWHVVMRFF